GTHDLARDVLKFAGLEPKRGDGSGDYTIVTLSYAELLEDREPASLPDAVFTVSGLPSPVVRALMATKHYHLAALPFGEAFALDALDPGDSATSPRPNGLRNEISRVKIFPAVIPPFTYGVEPARPPREITTFGPRLLLVANENVPTRAVRQLLE